MRNILFNKINFYGILCIAGILANFTISKECEIKDCFWKFINEYYKEQNTVILLLHNLEQKRSLFEEHFMDSQNTLLPMVFYTDRTQAQKETSVIYSYPPSKSLIFIIAYDQEKHANDILIKLYQQYKSNCHIVLINFNFNNKTTLEILENSWREHQMINTILFNIETQNLDRNKLHIKSIAIYDPFYINQNAKKRGLTYVFKITQFNIKNISYDIKITSRNRFIDLNQYPIRICMFSIDNIAEPIHDENGTITRYKYIGGDVVYTLTESVNFKPIFIEPQNRTEIPDMIISGKAELLGNFRHYEYFENHYIRHLSGGDSTEFVFITPKIARSNYKFFLNVYKRESWFAILCTFIAVLFIWYIVQYIHFTCICYQENNKESLHNLTFKLLSLFVLASCKQPIQAHDRFIFGSVALFTMIICCTYGGRLIQSLAINNDSEDINTLSDLVASNLDILVLPRHKFYLSGSDVKTVRDLYEKQSVIEDMHEGVFRIAVLRNASLMVTIRTAKSVQSDWFNNKTGEDLVHITREVIPTHGVLMVNGSSPYGDRFDKIMTAMVEAGFLTKWTNDQHYITDYLKLLKRNWLVIERMGVFNMDELSYVVKAWSLGMCLSIVVFFIELMVSNS